MTATPERRAPHTAPQTAERIKDAAVHVFATKGFSHSTVRDIAAEANVSPGLINHHFGGKAGLRAACDDHVLERVMDIKRAAGTGTAAITIEDILDTQMSTYIQYLRRMFHADAESAHRLFRGFADMTRKAFEEGLGDVKFKPGRDTEARAAAVTAQGLMVLVLGSYVQEYLATDTFEDAITRVQPELIDIYTHGAIDIEAMDPAVVNRVILAKKLDEESTHSGPPGS